MRLKLFILFCVLSILIYTIAQYEKNIKIQNYLENKTDLIDKFYKVQSSFFKQESQIIYNTILSKKKVISIYKQLQTANKKKSDSLRKELYDLLKDDYKKLSYIQLKQLHFHLKNNISFLRMHKVEKYGDDLTKVRKTVKFVNKNNKPISGFEMGKIYSGLRFVYPINDEQNNHLGSVEISFDISSFLIEFMRHYKLLANFYLSKELIDKKVWKEFIKQNYSKSILNGYLTENKSFNYYKKFSKELNIKDNILDQKLVNKALTYVKKNQKISIYDEKTNTIITFLPVLNPVTKENSVFVTIRSFDEYISNKTTLTNIVISFLIILMGMIFYLIGKDFINKEKINKYLKTRIEEETLLLSKSNEDLKLYKKVVDNVSSGVVITKYELKSNKFKIVYVNKVFEDITSYNISDLNNNSLSILYSEDIDQKEIKDISNAINKKQVCEVTLKNYKKDGSMFYNNLKLSPIFDEKSDSKEVMYYIGIINDVTERIEKDIKVKQQKNFLDTLIQEAPIPIFYKNIRGEYVSANNKWYEMTGFTKDYIKGKNVFDLYSNYDKNKASEFFEQDRKIIEKQNKTIVAKNKYFNVKTDEVFDVMMYKTAIYDQDNNISGIVGSIIDITELTKLQEEKLKQEKIIHHQAKIAEMADMLENIAHQWRQPLSVISTSISGMEIKKEMGILSDEDFFDFCKHINDNTQYLSKTIDDFKRILKGDSKPVSFSLHEDTNNFIEFINDIIKRYNIQLILDLNEDVNIKGYPSELIQCFINIFNNSKDAFEKNNIDLDKRYLFIEQYIKDDYVYINIKDSAGGINDDIIDKIFEPYFTTKHQAVGTGLGLHMVYRFITTVMKGSINVSNKEFKIKEDILKGALFEIRIPIILK